MIQRNRNPYANVDWQNSHRITGNTHFHCTRPRDWEYAQKIGVDFFTASNYYPSAPWYPMDRMTQNYFRCHHEHAVMVGTNPEPDAEFTPVENGTLTQGPFDWNKILADWIEDLPEEQRSQYPFKEGEKIFPPLPAHILEAPNAEHHGVTDAPGETHITGLGSFCATGTFDARNKFKTFRHGFGCGSGMPWRTLFQEILNQLQYPDGGGVVINHPTWSHMDQKLLHDMLDFDPRVLGIEALNGDCSRSNTAWSLDHWDTALRSGRQCYGFFATDHFGCDPIDGRIKILAKEYTAESALRAIRNGEFYGALQGKSVQFTSIKAENGVLSAATDRPAQWQFISGDGIVYETTGTEAACPFGSNSYLRIVAEDETGEKIFSQATFADSI